MKRIALYSIIAAAMVVSCTPDPIPEKTGIEASFEQPGASEGDDLLLRWTAEDRVSLFNKITYNQPYAFTGKTGDHVVGFQKVDTDEFITGNPISHVVSVFPYQEKTRIDESEVLSITLPAEQPYAENTFALEANTMVAVSSDNVLQYKNVGGYLMVSLYGEGVTVSSITLKGNNGEKMAGKASVTMPLNGEPSAVLADDAATTITLVCDTPVQLGATADAATPFWFVVPPMTFEKGLTITISGDGGYYTKEEEKSLTIQRNKLSKISPMAVCADDLHFYVPFEDQIFKNYCVSYYDKNMDGEIEIEEAKEITRIYLRRTYYYTPPILPVTSLRGIEYFTNLTELECPNHSLTSLDLSKNTALQSLDCASNRLTSLDVSNNPALTSLSCGYNQLSGLDVSNSPALTHLYCGANQLTSLDISHNPALTQLYCDYNQLTSLDVSNNPALTKLECEGNQLTSLDLSGNTELEYFVCSSNSLTNLNVSGCTALTHLHCEDNQLTSLDLSNNPTLKVLGCEHNQLTSLDMSRCAVLTSLYCEDNQLTNLDLSNNPKLTTLSCYNNQLTSLDVSGCANLNSLECYNNQLVNLNVGYKRNLVYIYCYDNRLTSLDVSESPALFVLWCYGNPTLLEIWLKNEQSVSDLRYDKDITTIKYKP